MRTSKEIKEELRKARREVRVLERELRAALISEQSKEE